MAKRLFKPGSLLLHPQEPLLVVNYAVLQEGNDAPGPPKQKQLRIDLARLGSYDDCVRLAAELVAQSKVVVKLQQSEVEQLLHQLYQRHAAAAADDAALWAGHARHPLSDDQGSEPARMDELDSYLEMLYDDALKVQGTAKLLALTRDVGNLEALLLQDPTVPSALARVLGEHVTQPRDPALLFNLLRLFLVVSHFYEMQEGVLAKHRAGSLTMRTLERELPAEGGVVMQPRLLVVGVWLLLNLATGNALVEEKIVKRQLIPRYLLPLAAAAHKTGSTDLLLLVLTFLKRLSVYEENVQDMATGHLVPLLVTLLPGSHDRVTERTLGVLYNLAFDPGLRREMRQEGLLPKLTALVTAKPALRTRLLKVLYLLLQDHGDPNDHATVIITLKELIFYCPRPTLAEEVAAVAIKATWVPDNVAQLCEKAGLRRLMDRVIKHRDPWVLKVVRNVSQWSLTTQAALADPENEYHLRNLWPSHIKPLLALLAGPPSSPPAVVVEVLGILANLTPFDLPVGLNWHDFVVPLQPPQPLWPYAKAQLLALATGTTHDEEAEDDDDDVLLQLLLLCQALALDPVHADDMTHDALFLTAVHNIWRRHAQQQQQHANDDPELVLQALVLVHRLLRRSSATTKTTWYSHKHRQDVVDMLRHRNPQVRRLADQCVALFLEEAEDWASPDARQLRHVRFEAHNAQWCALMAIDEEGGVGL